MITKLYPNRQRTHGRFAWGLFLAVLILALALGGGGGGGSGTSNVSDSGEAVIALTDAGGDFAAYTVDVTSINGCNAVCMTSRAPAVIQPMMPIRLTTK